MSCRLKSSSTYMSSSVERSLTHGPRKTERPVPHCCFRCANPCSSSLLQTEFHLFIWDTQLVFLWPSLRRDRDEAQRWSNASSALLMTSDDFNRVQTHNCFSSVYLICLEIQMKKGKLCFGLVQDGQQFGSQLYNNQTDKSITKRMPPVKFRRHMLQYELQLNSHYVSNN